MEEPQEKTLLITSIHADDDQEKAISYSDMSIDQLVKLAMDGFTNATEELTRRLGGINPFSEGK